jgi:ArsR family transcriptional regulator, arsenate/arsenite/antimonite-responsive transcriptional repressor / arsenate reductase (thioredoxin)
MNTEILAIETRARMHAALGDPARLSIVDRLTFGDASPGELGEALDMPTNLLAHHLNVLRDAGLIARTASEGDRRRTYVRLRSERLAGLVPPRLSLPKRVVFVCTRNTARSQLAAVLWRDRSIIPTASAGTQPADRIHPRAVRVARRHGLQLARAATADITDVLRTGDLVIAVCDTAHEHLPTRPDLHWSVRDPVPLDTDTAFEAAYADIAARVDRLAPALTPVNTP